MKTFKIWQKLLLRVKTLVSEKAQARKISTFSEVYIEVHYSLFTLPECIPVRRGGGFRGYVWVGVYMCVIR